MSEIVCYIYIYHLTSLVSPHYLVKQWCSKLLHDTGIYYNWTAQIWVCNSIEDAMYWLFILARSYYQTCASWPRTNVLFQQDGAPAHRAHDTVAFLERETPHFIPPTLWPPNSPDLNPVDYSIWSVLQENWRRFTSPGYLSSRNSKHVW